MKALFAKITISKTNITETKQPQGIQMIFFKTQAFAISVEKVLGALHSTFLRLEVERVVKGGET